MENSEAIIFLFLAGAALWAMRKIILGIIAFAIAFIVIMAKEVFVSEMSDDPEIGGFILLIVVGIGALKLAKQWIS